MRPLTFINGVIFGSTSALAGVLGIILLLRYVMTLDDSLDQAVIRGNLPLGELLHYLLVFMTMAVLAGFAFWGQLAERRWRWILEYALAMAISAVLIDFLAPSGARTPGLAILGAVAATGAALGTGAWRTGLLKRFSG